MSHVFFLGCECVVGLPFDKPSFLGLSRLVILHQSFASGVGRTLTKCYNPYRAYLNRSACARFLDDRACAPFSPAVKDESKCVVCKKSPALFEHFGSMCSSLTPPSVHCQNEFFFYAFIAVAHSGTSFMWHSWQGFTS